MGQFEEKKSLIVNFHLSLLQLFSQDSAISQESGFTSGTRSSSNIDGSFTSADSEYHHLYPPPTDLVTSLVDKNIEKVPHHFHYTSQHDTN